MPKTLWISDYKVLESPAGFYVGQECKNLYEDGSLVVEPYDRVSEYMTLEEAEEYLQYVQRYDEQYWDDVDEQQEWYDFDPDC